MNINRSNYETWIIDWLDDNLSKEAVDTLMAFLEQNPDIKRDIESLEKTRLMPEPLYVRGKNDLKHSPLDLSAEQIEGLSVAELEKDITPTQQFELNMALQGSQSAKKAHDIILKTKLTPSNEHYDKKESLKRINKSVIIYRTIISAVAIIAIVFLLFVHNNDTPSKGIYVSEAKNVSDTQQPTTIATNTNDNPTENVTIDTIIEDTVQKSIVEKTEPIIIAKLSDILTNIFIEDTISIYPSDDSDANVEEMPVRSVIEGMQPIDVPIKMLHDDYLAINDKLIDTYTPTYKESDTNGDRTFIHKYIAKFFRERFLEEENADNSAIKKYELTEAWVNTINRLMETEITLTKYTDDDGNIESVKINHRRFNFKKEKNETEL